MDLRTSFSVYSRRHLATAVPRLEVLQERALLSFLPAVSYAGGSPRSVVAADLRGVGVLDLANTNVFGRIVNLRLGYGDGSFQDSLNQPLQRGVISIETADLNNDGRLDLVTGNGTSGTISVLLGNGNGTLQLSGTYSAGPGATDVAIGDVNRHIENSSARDIESPITRFAGS